MYIIDNSNGLVTVLVTQEETSTWWNLSLHRGIAQPKYHYHHPEAIKIKLQVMCLLLRGIHFTSYETVHHLNG